MLDNKKIGNAAATHAQHASFELLDWTVDQCSE